MDGPFLVGARVKDPRSGRTSPQEEAPNPKIQPRPRIRMQTARGLFKYTHRYLWAAKSLGGLAHPRLGRGFFYRKEDGRSGITEARCMVTGILSVSSNEAKNSPEEELSRVHRNLIITVLALS